MDFKNELHNEFLKMYLNYVEDTESPRLFHLWAALSGAGACLGRRMVFPFGIADIYGSQFILLVGPPGARKSTAIKIIERRLRAATSLRFAPSDTGGKYQGLITAMVGSLESNDEIEDMLNADAMTMIDQVGAMQVQIDSRDAHVMYVCASEFTTFVGQNSMDMITFLGKAWDGEDYDYQLKSSQAILENPLLSLIGGTTPSNIATSLPPESVGQGFTSRIIMVYANEKYKKVARPKRLCSTKEQLIDKTFNYIFYEMSGEFKEEDETVLDGLYEDEIKIADPRFIYYCERRHTHLIKLCMALAALRKSDTITLKDIADAQLILKHTEIYMPEALGEFGLSPLSQSKQKLLEFLRHAKGAVSLNILQVVMSNDMKRIDFHNTLSELINAKKIARTKDAAGKDAYIYVSERTKEIDAILNNLVEVG